MLLLTTPHEEGMHRSTILVAAIYVVVVSCQRTWVSKTCNGWEVRVRGAPRPDTFCKPRLTSRWELKKRRFCVCKRGRIRNAWGQCITMQQCNHCKRRKNQDFNYCESACPWTCNRPIPRVCTFQCVVGCACAPGFVRDPRRNSKTCISARRCPPRCPANSRFELCISDCVPKCGKLRPRKCVTRCNKGGCVCRRGFSEHVRNDRKVCVPTRMCPRAH